MSPLEEFKEDLAELARYQPTARRIFLTGANPFVMSYENLAERALLIHDYLVECQTIAMFSSIRDIKNKKVWQLKKLRSLGINGISIGTESGDNSTLPVSYTHLVPTAFYLEQIPHGRIRGKPSRVSRGSIWPRNWNMRSCTGTRPGC